MSERGHDERAHPPEKDDLTEVDNLEIAPLSEEDLNAVVGGAGRLDSECTDRETANGRIEI